MMTIFGSPFSSKFLALISCALLPEIFPTEEAVKDAVPGNLKIFKNCVHNLSFIYSKFTLGPLVAPLGLVYLLL